MTDKKTEALLLALEALKSVADHRPNDETNAAIIAIREALAEQPTQTPVAVYRAGRHGEPYHVQFLAHMEGDEVFLYASPQPAQEQEPVVTKNKSGITLHVGWDDLPVGTKLYTSPPASKPWVGLSEEDFYTDMFSITSLGVCDIATIKSISKDVEAKLKEKNT